MVQADSLQQSLSIRAWNCCSFTFWPAQYNIKIAISFMNLCNTFFKASSKVFFVFFFFLSKTKERYEVNKTVSTSRTDSLGMQPAPKKDINHWNLAAKKLHTVSVFTRAYSQRFPKLKGQCTWPESLTIFYLQILSMWKITIIIEEIMKVGLEFPYIDSTFIGIIIIVAISVNSLLQCDMKKVLWEIWLKRELLNQD